VSKGLISPRGRPPALGDMGQHSAAVAGQRVGRVRRRRPARRVRWRWVLGATTLTVDLSAEGKTYLQGAWSGSNYTDNPSARATFGVFGSQPRNFIFQRENY